MTDNLPTPLELSEIAEEELRLALDPHGTGAVDLHDGSRNTALVSMQVGVAMRIVRYAADREAASRASTATGDDLEVVARDFYGELRKDEAFATGQVRLSRAAGRPATTIPQGSRFAVPATEGTPSVVFVARETVAVLANETAVTVPLVASEAGEAANINDPADVGQIVDPLPDQWAIAAPLAGFVFGGGAVREDDEVLRARLLQIGTEDNDQRGTRRAILAGALRVAGVRHVTAVEPLNGSVVLFVGDVNYALTEAMQDAVRAELLEWRCFGIPVDLRSYTVDDVAVQATVYMARRLEEYDVTAVARAGAAHVRAYFDARPHPDEYFREMIIGAIGKGHPEMQHVVLAAPGSDALRLPPSGYASAVTLVRYRLLEGAVRLTFQAPVTS